MILLISIVAVGLLLAGFILLTQWEYARGHRVLEGARTGLDVQAARLSYIVHRIDMGTMLAHAVHAGGAYVLHAILDGILGLVRLVERSLTSLLRSLHAREALIEHSRSYLSRRISRILGKRESK